MTEVYQKIKELDGKQLYHSFLAGAQRIFEQQKLLNKINVFPVADADTGTNLASTMRSIMDAIIPTDNLKQTAVAMADAALSGARGNSGIIFAQFLYGFGNELSSESTLDIKTFAESMKKAVAYAYDAIANPVEGTILTVIKEWADHLDSIKDRIDDFIRLLIEAYNKALEALAGTTRKLEVLAKSHVVDAGAKGFVYFLEGIKDFFTLGQPETAITAHADQSAGEQVEVQHDVITFRFCTEALITGQNLELKKIRGFLEHSGDSLVVAGSRTKLRVHIHTDYPIEVMSRLQKFGDITYQKVDDMIFQNNVLLERRSDIAIMTDSTCDLPRELIDHYQIHVVPLNLHFGHKAIYKYGASDSRYQQLRANNLVMWEAIRWYAGRGFKEFCFGRTEPENEGLLQFKRGWGPRERSIKYYRFDLRQNAYVKEKQKIHGFHNKVFSRMPMPMLKLAGEMLYKHIG